LEGYKNKNLKHWLGQNTATVYKTPIVVSLCGLVLMLIVNAVLSSVALYAFFVFAALYVLLIFSYAKKSRVANAKKPLVYTSRVKRLFAFISFFYVVASAALLLLDLLMLSGSILAHLPFFLLFIMIGLGVLCANFLAKPVEKAVQNWYLNDARKRLEERSDIIRIGITGSYGKTSCKFILGTILSEKYNVLVPPSSFNTPMGLTRVIREQMKPSHEVFIAEMGARNVGDIKELCDLVHPKFGLLTSVGPQHLETFGSIENIAKTKYELIESLPQDGCAFFPGDNDICRKLHSQTKIEKKLFSVNYTGESDVRAENIKTGSFGSRFELVLGEERVVCETKLLGKHNISNIVGCVSVAHKLGLSAAQIRLGIRKIQPVEHRLQMLPTFNGITVIDDAFNANPSGVRAAMEVLAGFEGRKVVVTPGMVELGDQEENENRAFGLVMADVADTVMLIGPKHTRPIYEGLIGGGFKEENIQVYKSLDEAAKVLWTLVKPGDVVIFENDLPDNYNE
jgi:UDP-N-acetylmuramoyl-tripeptide--D-alanyl-D-alanine ligase